VKAGVESCRIGFREIAKQRALGKVSESSEGREEKETEREKKKGVKYVFVYPNEQASVIGTPPECLPPLGKANVSTTPSCSSRVQREMQIDKLPMEAPSLSRWA
jgi:hypothetical protein